MATIEELRERLPYPTTYVPLVAGQGEQTSALQLARQPGTDGEVVLRPYILCQDWDKRVFLHWKDERRAHTLELTRILEDTAERFCFHASEEQPVTYTLTPLTLAVFNAGVREEYERHGHVPDFTDDGALHAWLLRR
jgi:hypothetical protein